MKKGFAAVLSIALLVLGPTAGASETLHRYALDQGSSLVAKVSFLGLASKAAGFPKLSGSLAIDPGRPQAIDLDVVIDARALTAPDKDTLNRLRGKDFFAVDQFPTVRYRGTSMRMTGERTAEVSGQITARGVTRPSTLKVTFDTPVLRAGRGQPVTISGETRIDRRQFGMTAYQLVVGNTVTIRLNAKMRPQ